MTTHSLPELVPASLPGTVIRAVADITPYPGNPRRITEESVAAVEHSIREYGYLQPIVVDRDNVVVVGHTRLEAIKKLGWTEVPVYVTHLPESKVKEYRLIDNRSAELTSWDFDSLVLELREFDQQLIADFFPDIDLEVGQINDAITDAKAKDAAGKVGVIPPAQPINVHTTDVTCPACFHTFAVRTKSLPGLSHEDLDELVESAPGRLIASTEQAGDGREAV